MLRGPWDPGYLHLRPCCSFGRDEASSSGLEAFARGPQVQASYPGPFVTTRPPSSLALGPGAFATSRLPEGDPDLLGALGLRSPFLVPFPVSYTQGLLLAPRSHLHHLHSAP